MGIEKITSKIMEEAGTQADEIIAKAQVKVDGIIEDAKIKAEDIKKKAEVDGLEEKDKVIGQKKAVADIDSRKLLLEKKQEMIDSCFKRAVKKIMELDVEEYSAFIVNVVKMCKVKEGQLILNKGDKERIGSTIIEKIKGALPDSNFTLSEETGKFTGGVVVKSGQVYINGTVDTFVSEAKEEMALKISEVLFR